MFSRRRSYRPSHALVVAYLALFFAIGGGTAAALTGSNTVFSDDITNNEVRSEDVRNDDLSGGGLASRDVRPNALTSSDVSALTGADVNDNSLTGNDVDESSLGKVTGAVNADNALSANNAGALGGVPASGYQRRCKQGATKGMARVKGDAANFPTNPNPPAGADPAFIDQSFSCAGGSVRAGRTGEGDFQVVFDGLWNVADLPQLALVTVDSASEAGSGEDDFATATRATGASWDVKIRDADGGREDATFYIVLF